MKDIIQKALSKAFAQLKNEVGNNTKVWRTISIGGVMPCDIVSFMKKNNVPDTATFTATYDGNINLCWQKDCTEEERLDFKRRVFMVLSNRIIVPMLRKSGYKRTPDSINKLPKNITVYDMYVNSDMDGLLDYYSFLFVKEE